MYFSVEKELCINIDNYKHRGSSIIVYEIKLAILTLKN